MNWKKLLTEKYTNGNFSVSCRGERSFLFVNGGISELGLNAICTLIFNVQTRRLQKQHFYMCVTCDEKCSKAIAPFVEVIHTTPQDELDWENLVIGVDKHG